MEQLNEFLCDIKTFICQYTCIVIEITPHSVTVQSIF